MHNACLDYVACPLCRASLSTGRSVLRCRQCHQQYQYLRGIPILSTQMVSNRQAFMTELSGSLFASLLQFSPEEMDDAWQDFYINFTQAISSHTQASRMVLNMVDETKAAIKFLLNISPGDHILNLGPGWDNTSVSLARTATKVTVLDLDLLGLEVLQFKKRKYNLDNIDLLFGGDLDYWPIGSNTFDAVMVQDSLIWSIITSARARGYSEDVRLSASNTGQHHLKRSSVSGNSCLPALLSEIKRVLKPNGSLFLGVRPYERTSEVDSALIKITAWLDEDAFPANLQEKRLKHNRAVFRNQRLMKSEIENFGFRLGHVYQIKTRHNVPEKMIEIAAGSGRYSRFAWIDAILRNWRSHLPAPARSSVGLAAFGSTQGQSWIDGMLQDFSAVCEISPRLYLFSQLHVSRKGKVVVLLRDAHTNQCSLVIKVPLHKNAQKMLDRNHRTLICLNKLKLSAKTSDLLLRVIPKCLHVGIYNGQTYFAEQGCEGVAWSRQGFGFSDKAVWRQMLRLLANLNQIANRTDVPETLIQQYNRRLKAIDVLLDNLGETERRGWEIVKDSISESLLNCPGRIYFRKGDCSLHNIMVKSGRVTGLIDFDEAGWTLFKTVDLADFLFSYARTRKKIDRAAFIKMVMQGNYDQLDLRISMRECLDYLNADPVDLKISILISWIDQVYHAIQSEAIKYRKYILKQAFAKTVVALKPVVGLL